MRKLNIKRIIKLNVIIAVLAVLLILFVHSTSLSYKEVEYNEIYVSSGDTLWNIAKSEQEDNEYYKGKDVREIIFDIKKVNNLTSPDLKVGQKLLIPSL